MKVVDLHCDMLNEFKYAIYRGEQYDFANAPTMINLDKLRRGDYMLQCFALFTHFNRDDPLIEALDEYDELQKLLAAYPDDIRQVFTMKDIEENRRAGRISALLTIEDGGCCRGRLSVLRLMYRLGVRLMTLTWNFENELGFPNSAANDGQNAYPTGADTSNGLKETGFAFLAEMERLGIIPDVSHLSDAGFWDIYNHTTRPFIASHSNARTLSGHPRNLTDDMLRAIAERGGIAGINYLPNFLNKDWHDDNAPSTCALMVDHMEYMRKIGGVDMIALGSDFDGIEGDLELYDASCLPLLEREMRRRGFHEAEIEKVFSGNALRVFGEFLPKE